MTDRPSWMPDRLAVAKAFLDECAKQSRLGADMESLERLLLLTGLRAQRIAFCVALNNGIKHNSEANRLRDRIDAIDAAIAAAKEEGH